MANGGISLTLFGKANRRRIISKIYALRLSTGFYNSEGDLDRLAAALQTILAADPEALPEFVSPW